ncbi:hypothetical protein V5799_013053, partial [Amblyomma americanum]
RAGESRRSDAAAPDYDGGDFDYPPYHSYWPPATATDKRKDGKGGHHYHHRHRQGRRRYDDFVGDYDSYDYYGGKHDYKHEYDIVFPLLILIMAPLAVSAFLLPITASLMTNTFFLVNGATSAAIQGRRRRRSLRQLAPSAEELRNLEEVLLRAISKYGDFEEAVVPETRSSSKTPNDPRSPGSRINRRKSLNKSKGTSAAPETLAAKTSPLATGAGVAPAPKVDRASDSQSPNDASGQRTSTQRSDRQDTIAKEHEGQPPLTTSSKRPESPHMGQEGPKPDEQTSKEKRSIYADTTTEDNEFDEATKVKRIERKPSVTPRISQDTEVPKKRLEKPPQIGQEEQAPDKQARKEKGSTPADTVQKDNLNQPNDIKEVREKSSIPVQTTKNYEVSDQKTDVQEVIDVPVKPTETGQDRQVQGEIGSTQGIKDHDDGTQQPKRSGPRGRRKSATFATPPLDDRTASRGGTASFASPAEAQSPRFPGSPSADKDGSKEQADQDGIKQSKTRHRGYWSPPLRNKGTPPATPRRSSAATVTSKAASASATTADGDSQWKTNPLLALILRASRSKKASESLKKQRVSSTASSVDAESLKRRRTTGSEGAAEPAIPAFSSRAKSIAVFGQAAQLLSHRHAVVMTPEESGSPDKRVHAPDEVPLQARYSRHRRACLVCLALGIVAALALAVFFGSRRATMQPMTTAPDENSLRRLCANEACKSLVGRLLDSANASVDPCANFHHHVCGQWDHPARGRGKRQSYLQENLINHTLQLHRALEAVTSSPALLDQAEHNMALFYRSCHDFLADGRSVAKEATVPEILHEMGIDETSVRVATFQDVFALAVAESAATGLPSILRVTQKIYFQGDEYLNIIDVGATLVSTLPQGYVEGYLDDSISQMSFTSGLDVPSVVKLDKNLDELRVACEHPVDSLKMVKELGEPFPGADWLEALNGGHAQNRTSPYAPDSNVTIRGESCIFAMLRELHGVNVTDARAYSLLVMIAQIKKYALTVLPWRHDETQRTTECVSITAQIFRGLFLRWMTSKLVGVERSRAFAVMVTHLQEAVDRFPALPERLNLTANDYEVRRLFTGLI